MATTSNWLIFKSQSHYSGPPFTYKFNSKSQIHQLIFPYLRCVLYQVQKHNIFSLQTNSRMKRVTGFRSEHSIEKWCRHVRKIFTWEIILEISKDALLNQLKTSFISYEVNYNAYPVSRYKRWAMLFQCFCSNFISSSIKANTIFHINRGHKGIFTSRNKRKIMLYRLFTHPTYRGKNVVSQS